MTTAIILGRRVKKVLFGGVVCLALPASVPVDGDLPVLLWNESRWTTTIVRLTDLVGVVYSFDPRLPAARASAERLL